SASLSERPRRSRDFVLLGVVGAAVCCGLPLLLGAGAAVTIVGVGLRSWLLVAAGATAAVAGYAQWRHHRERPPPTARTVDDNVTATNQHLPQPSVASSAATIVSTRVMPTSRASAAHAVSSVRARSGSPSRARPRLVEHRESRRRA